MEVLSIIITVGGLLFHIISKINESSGSSRSNVSHNNAASYLNTYELSSNEKLESMNVNGLTECYASARISNYNLIKGDQALRSRFMKGFEVKEIIIQGKCLNVKIKHALPYNSGANDFGSAFSVNYIEPTENIMIYGFDTHNPEEQKAFFAMANEIINELSK